MIILTTLGAHRCSVPPDRIVAVEAGPPTTLVLQGGLTVAVREEAVEVARRIDASRARANAHSALGVGPTAEAREDAPEVARRLEAARNEGAALSGNGRGRR